MREKSVCKLVDVRRWRAVRRHSARKLPLHDYGLPGYAWFRHMSGGVVSPASRIWLSFVLENGVGHNVGR